MIKRANAEDTEILAALAIQMWTGHNLKNLAEEFRKLVMNGEAVRRIMNPLVLLYMTEGRMNRKAPLPAIICTMK